MTRAQRRFLYLAFSALFLVLAPSVLLFGAGYRRVPGTWRIAPSGYLVLRTAQTPDRIVLDGRVVAPKGRETRFPSITVGPHDVRIEKAGFVPWQRHVTVERGVAKAYTNIALVPAGPYQTVASAVTRLAAALNGPWVALLRREAPYLELAQDGEPAQPVDGLAQSIRTVLWNARGDRLLALAEDGRTVHVLHIGTPPLLATTFTVAEQTDVLGWDPVAVGNILLRRNGTVQSVRPGDAAGIVRGSDVMAVYGRQETLYLLEAGTTLHVVAPGVDRSFSLATTFSNAAVFLPTPAPYLTLLDPASRTVAVLRGTDGAALWQRRNVVVASWSLAVSTLVVGDGFETSLWRPSKPDETVLLNRTSDPFEQLLWLPPTRYVLTRHHNAVRLLEAGLGQPVQIVTLPVRDPVIEAAAAGRTVWLRSEDGVVRALTW